MRRRAFARTQSLVGLGDEESAARAYEAFAMTPVRMEILRLALSRKEVSTADVMNEFAITRNGALVHLKRIAAQGLLRKHRCTHLRGSGPITYWRADPDELDAIVRSLLGHLYSGPVPISWQSPETGAWSK
jgi:hypothetical protein